MQINKDGNIENSVKKLSPLELDLGTVGTSVQSLLCCPGITCVGHLGPNIVMLSL